MAQKKNSAPAKAAEATHKSCILTTSLATLNLSYRPGDKYTGSIAEVNRLIARNMATALKD